MECFSWAVALIAAVWIRETGTCLPNQDQNQIENTNIWFFIILKYFYAAFHLHTLPKVLNNPYKTIKF